MTGDGTPADVKRLGAYLFCSPATIRSALHTTLENHPRAAPLIAKDFQVWGITRSRELIQRAWARFHEEFDENERQAMMDFLQ